MRWQGPLDRSPPSPRLQIHPLREVAPELEPLGRIEVSGTSAPGFRRWIARVKGLSGPVDLLPRGEVTMTIEAAIPRRRWERTEVNLAVVCGSQGEILDDIAKRALRTQMADAVRSVGVVASGLH